MNNTSNVTNIQNGHPFVDLGLPSGLLWATCNVGATSPEQAGRYFAWGETEGFTAEQIARGERKFYKTSYKAKKIKEHLTLEQDAAHVYMGGNWRMPTRDEYEELISPSYTTQTWTTDYNETGVKGYVITSKTNGNSIFLPAAGYCYGFSMLGVSRGGHYWSASIQPLLTPNSALLLLFHSCDICAGGINNIFCGHPVRAVCER